MIILTSTHVRACSTMRISSFGNGAISTRVIHVGTTPASHYSSRSCSTRLAPVSNNNFEVRESLGQFRTLRPKTRKTGMIHFIHRKFEFPMTIRANDTLCSIAFPAIIWLKETSGLISCLLIFWTIQSDDGDRDSCVSLFASI